jgi:hypothetical protein
MKNRFYNIACIFLFYALISAFSGCENAVTPQNFENNRILNSECKWLVDVANKDKISKVHYKEYDKNGKILINEEYSESGNLLSRSSYTYNKINSVEEVVQFSDSGSVINSNKNEYTYDANGRVVKKISFETSGNVISVQTFNYDKNGNLIKKVEVNPQSGLTFQTDINYGYNNSGELVSRTTIFEGNTQSRDSLVYNPFNHTLDIINFNNNGSINIVNTYRYNNQGRIVEEFTSDSAGNITKRYIYEYTYFN